MKILDITAGNRAVWFDRDNPLATFVDIRESVAPDVVANSADLPAEWAGVYDLVVFDPPHKSNGAGHGMSRSYGNFTMREIRDLLNGGAREAHRCSKARALMAFKWNTHHLKLDSALAEMGAWWVPLFGHGLHPQQRARSETAWVLLLRRD